MSSPGRATRYRRMANQAHFDVYPVRGPGIDEDVIILTVGASVPYRIVRDALYQLADGVSSGELDGSVDRFADDDQPTPTGAFITRLLTRLGRRRAA